MEKYQSVGLTSEIPTESEGGRSVLGAVFSGAVVENLHGELPDSRNVIDKYAGGEQWSRVHYDKLKHRPGQESWEEAVKYGNESYVANAMRYCEALRSDIVPSPEQISLAPARYESLYLAFQLFRERRGISVCLSAHDKDPNDTTLAVGKALRAAMEMEFRPAGQASMPDAPPKRGLNALVQKAANSFHKAEPSSALVATGPSYLTPFAKGGTKDLVFHRILTDIVADGRQDPLVRMGALIDMHLLAGTAVMYGGVDRNSTGVPVFKISPDVQTQFASLVEEILNHSDIPVHQKIKTLTFCFDKLQRNVTAFAASVDKFLASISQTDLPMESILPVLEDLDGLYVDGLAKAYNFDMGGPSEITLNKKGKYTKVVIQTEKEREEWRVLCKRYQGNVAEIYFGKYDSLMTQLGTLMSDPDITPERQQEIVKYLSNGSVYLNKWTKRFDGRHEKDPRPKIFELATAVNANKALTPQVRYELNQLLSNAAGDITEKERRDGQYDKSYEAVKRIWEMAGFTPAEAAEILEVRYAEALKVDDDESSLEASALLITLGLKEGVIGLSTKHWKDADQKIFLQQLTDRLDPHQLARLFDHVEIPSEYHPVGRETWARQFPSTNTLLMNMIAAVDNAAQLNNEGPWRALYIYLDMNYLPDLLRTEIPHVLTENSGGNPFKSYILENRDAVRELFTSVTRYLQDPQAQTQLEEFTRAHPYRYIRYRDSEDKTDLEVARRELLAVGQTLPDDPQEIARQQRAGGENAFKKFQFELPIDNMKEWTARLNTLVQKAPYKYVQQLATIFPSSEAPAQLEDKTKE